MKTIGKSLLGLFAGVPIAEEQYIAEKVQSLSARSGYAGSEYDDNVSNYMSRINISFQTE